MRLLLDQGVPRDVSLRFRDKRIECQHVGELGMSKSADTEILAWAREHDAVIITLDADFHTILAVSGADSPSVIRLRVQGLDGGGVASVVEGVLKDFSGAILSAARW